MSKWWRVGEVIALLEADGWTRIRVSGPLQQFRHSSKSGVLTLAGGAGEPMPVELVRLAFRHAQVPWGVGGGG